MRQAIEMQLGLRNPNQSDNQITESNAPEQLNGEALNSQVFSVANAIGGGAALSQSQSHAAARTHEQSPSILPHLGASDQSIIDGYSHTDYSQLYSLFDIVPGSTQQRELPEMQLWDAFNSSNIFLPENQDPDMSEKQV